MVHLAGVQRAQNLNGNTVTGGINIGSAAGGNDIVATLAVGANALIVVPNASVLKRASSTTAPTNLFVSGRLLERREPQRQSAVAHILKGNPP